MTKMRGTGDTICRGAIGAILVCAAACASDDKGGSRDTKEPTVAIPAGGISAGAAGRFSSALAGSSSTVVPTAGVSGGVAGAAPTAPAVPGPAAGQGAPPLVPRAGTGAAEPAPAGPPPEAGPPVGTGTTCLKPGNGNYNNPGPYKIAMKTVDLGMIEATQHTGKFTIYYPNPLEESCLHPIVSWGNGTGVQGQGIYAFLNTNAASWGMVVAEAEEDNTGSGKHHKAGIDYLLKENADPSSMFYKKLSTRAGTSGHSQGGFGANLAASHPNVVTSAIEGAGGVATAKVSMLVLTGTEDIVMNAGNLVSGAKGPMFVAVWEGGDHFATETLLGYIAGDKGSLQFQRLYAAWFRCFLGDDAVACKMFSGGTPDGCGICKDPGWNTLASKNL